MVAGNIQTTLLDTVLALSAGLDLTRVKHQFYHRQTAYISWHLGRELGLSPAEMEELLVSALLHDSAMLWGEEEEVEEIYRPTTIRVYRHAIMGYLLMSDFPLLRNFFPFFTSHNPSSSYKLEGSDRAGEQSHSPGDIERNWRRYPSRQLYNQFWGESFQCF